MIRLMLDDQYKTIPWDIIDTVVFDVGNVLLNFDQQELLRTFYPDLTDAQKKHLWVKILNTPYWAMLDHGTITTEEAIQAMVGFEKDMEPSIRYFMSHWLDTKKPVEEGVRTLKNVKQHGKKLIVLSNYQEEAFHTVRSRFEFFELFDGYLVSAELKMMKPQYEIYRYAIDRYGLDPSRTLFIDDSPINIEAALVEGWQGICFNEKGKLDRFFKNP